MLIRKDSVLGNGNNYSDFVVRTHVFRKMLSTKKKKVT